MICTPIFWSKLSSFSLTAVSSLAAWSSAAPPPATMPSSTAAFGGGGGDGGVVKWFVRGVLLS
jgi:hypothetical protein